jgi:osmoprotectant transport system substrate-binding protein
MSLLARAVGAGRRGRRPRRAALAAIATLVAVGSVALAGCDGARPVGQPNQRRPAGQVVVASFNFPESDLLGTIYALALEHAGIPVRRELDLGPRELLQPALRQGLVDVVPEYLGSALASLQPASGARSSSSSNNNNSSSSSSSSSRTTDGGAPGGAERAGSTAEQRQQLEDRLAPLGLRVLEPSPAENQNGFAVTRATADRLGLRTLGELAPVAGTLTLTGPSECPERAYCLAGLESVYGLRLGRFVAYDDQRQRLQALVEGVADVAVVFTTDPQLLSGDVVLLADDRGLQPAENVTPVVSARAVDRYGAQLTDPLDAISARLTTTTLAFLNWRVVVHGGDVEAEAQAWLRRQGLLPR